jgi:hypothetical protein
VDTYLRFAEAVNRLDLMQTETQGLPGVMEEIRGDGSGSKAKGALQGAKEALFSDEEGENPEPASARRRRSSSGQTRRRRTGSSRSKS